MKQNKRGKIPYENHTLNSIDHMQFIVDVVHNCRFPPSLGAHIKFYFGQIEFRRIEKVISVVAAVCNLLVCTCSIVTVPTRQSFADDHTEQSSVPRMNEKI